MRGTLLTIFIVAMVTNRAAAQNGGITPGFPFPSLGFPLQNDNNSSADNSKTLPYRELPTEIRIELAADTLYDFDRGAVRPSAADYLDQTANLIFGRAKGPVHIECRSDRSPLALAQKLAAACAAAISQWLIVKEKLTNVKFTTAAMPSTTVAAPGSNPLARAAMSKNDITIVFPTQ